VEVANFRFIAHNINAHGGLNGHPIKIVPYDNKGNAKATLVQFRKAANDGIRYVLNGNGDNTASAVLHAIRSWNRANPDKPVLYLNYAAINPEYVNQRCSFYHFLFDANTRMKMEALTSYIAKDKDIHSVYLINQDYAFGHDVARYAQKMLAKKRPDIKIAGSVFVPLGSVKDFSPYVARIKASGADAIITGNWGSDLILLAKAEASFGLDIPTYTYYAQIASTPTALGTAGVNRIYAVAQWPGGFSNPVMAKREVAFKKASGFDYTFPQAMYTLHMLRKAANKDHSVDPTQVAFALEGLTFKTPAGTGTMRAKNHQLLAPLYISVFTNHMKYSLGNTDHLNFKPLAKIDPDRLKMPTTCRMRNRPSKP
jgi:branched-chain amino acid transport system substrate-binding protein